MINIEKFIAEIKAINNFITKQKNFMCDHLVDQDNVPHIKEATKHIKKLIKTIMSPDILKELEGKHFNPALDGIIMAFEKSLEHVTNYWNKSAFFSNGIINHIIDTLKSYKTVTYDKVNKTVTPILRISDLRKEPAFNDKIIFCTLKK